MSRILLVDDDVALTHSLGRFLEKAGFQVRTENHGARAVEAAREFGPDLILLDIIMPDKDGNEVVVELEQDEELADIPVVFLTGLISADELGSTERTVGGHPFIAKPIEPAELVRHIRHFLDTPPERKPELVSVKELLGILNRSLWQHEACALCEFAGAIRPAEDAGGSGPNWIAPDLRCEAEGLAPDECRSVADGVLTEAALRYDVLWEGALP